MAATNNIVVKITNGTEIRRFTSTTDALGSWKDFSKRVKTLFERELLHKTFKMSYVDDEGDQITISSDEELVDAAAFALSLKPSVLRLAVYHVSDKPDRLDKPERLDKPASPRRATTTATDDAPMEDAPDKNTDKNTNSTDDTDSTDKSTPNDADPLAGFLKTLAGQLPAALAAMPEGVRNLIPQAELDVAATVAANAADNASCLAAEARKAMAAMASASASANHCAAADSARQAMEGIEAGRRQCRRAPMHPGVTMPRGVKPIPGAHAGVTCDKSGMCPIVGNRYHLVGHNYDLCEAEFLKLDDKEKALFRKITPQSPEMGEHRGITCDRSEMCPIVGMRYHLRGHNYDLCEAEFNKLPASEKQLYTAIPPPPKGNNPANFNGPNGLHNFFNGPHGRRGGHPWGGPRGGGWNNGCGWGSARNDNNNNNTTNNNNGNGAPPKLAARFVRDVTIFDGTQMASGTAFTKIWRLKNVGEVPWPPGTRMLFVGGDQMTTEMAVPLSRAGPVLPGEEVDVAVEMVAPEGVGRYLGYWRLVGPRGRKFGQRVWCHVQVVDPASSELLAEEDLKRTISEIQQKKTALAATEEGADAHDDDDHDEDEITKVHVVVSTEPVTDTTNTKTDDTVKDAKQADDDEARNTMRDTTTKGVPLMDAVPAGQPPSTAEPAADDDEGAKSEDSDAVMVDADEAKADVVDGGGDVTKVELTKKTPSAASALLGAVDLTDPVDGVRASLGMMGFEDPPLVDAVLAKHGADLEACARDLAAASEWAPLLDDLEDMGFADRDLNKMLMLKHAGNLKRTVKELVEDLH